MWGAAPGGSGGGTVGGAGSGVSTVRGADPTGRRSGGGAA